MRTAFFFAVLGLLIVEALLLPRAVRDFQTMRKMRAETAPEAGIPASLSPFAGYDAEGRPLALVNDDTKWILPVIIHAGQGSSDLDYLNRLRKAVPDRAIVLLGVCDGIQCGDRSRPADFPILAYGSYAPLTDIARFDDRHEILILNAYWGVKQSLPRAASAEEMAAEIQRVIAK